MKRSSALFIQEIRARNKMFLAVLALKKLRCLQQDWSRLLRLPQRLRQRLQQLPRSPGPHLLSLRLRQDWGSPE